MKKLPNLVPWRDSISRLIASVYSVQAETITRGLPDVTFSYQTPPHFGIFWKALEWKLLKYVM
jgi:hypothetical protein